MDLITIILVFLHIGVVSSQTQTRHVNEGIAETQRIVCQNLNCGDTGVCELNGTTVCEGLPPWCPGPQPHCVPKPRNQENKPGICLDADYVQNHDMERFTDWGCPSNQLCCHGHYGSRCLNVNWRSIISQPRLRRILLFLRQILGRNQQPKYLNFLNP